MVCQFIAGSDNFQSVTTHSQLLREINTQSSVIWISLIRAPAPLLINTRLRLQAKWRETSSISSSLALPSTGGAFSLADQIFPSDGGVSTLSRAFGLTLICNVIKGIGPGLDQTRVEDLL